MRSALFGFFIGALVPHFALADDPVKLTYLQPESVDVRAVMPAPPAAGSAEERADLQAVLDLQAKRDDTTCILPKYEAHASLDHFFGPKYGPLSKEDVEKWTPLFETLLNEVYFFALEAKGLYVRPRPFTVSALVQPCLEISASNSYPSGHAMIATVYAEVLDLIFPDRKDDIDRIAKKVGVHRVVSGVHFPTDIEAGEKLGEEIFEALLKTQSFLRDVDRVEFQTKRNQAFK